ncbi:hypothetical protein N780_05750 [Pontibacillus chungwhensis BH030062]|uniref:Uncharacterized protein n=1 Tax=Pontibacillus chungwhensis BH030062 TaxID=1385513 RepID=A0A0A2UPS6_9BACI|nr:hypothetical protein [Pontibacillus chungwhensis]KGP90287.1 hypothetical protein N780_05750 [Pontibacillus chungwhensis BH030062]
MLPETTRGRLSGLLVTANICVLAIVIVFVNNGGSIYSVVSLCAISLLGIALSGKPIREEQGYRKSIPIMCTFLSVISVGGMGLLPYMLS